MTRHCFQCKLEATCLYIANWRIMVALLPGLLYPFILWIGLQVYVYTQKWVSRGEGLGVLIMWTTSGRHEVSKLCAEQKGKEQQVRPGKRAEKLHNVQLDWCQPWIHYQTSYNYCDLADTLQRSIPHSLFGRSNACNFTLASQCPGIIVPLNHLPSSKSCLTCQYPSHVHSQTYPDFYMLTIVHESRRVGRPGSICHVNAVRRTWGGSN